MYDEKGILIPKTGSDLGMDICDCLRENCKGCFFECKSCQSQKCGNTCRSNRNTFYEKIEIEGSSKFRVMPGNLDND